MEFVESHGIIGGVFKEAILENSFSKSKPFEDFQSSLPMFNFDNFAIFFFLDGKIFGSLWHTVL